MKKKFLSSISVILVLAIMLSAFTGITASALTLSRPKVTGISTDCASVTVKWEYDNQDGIPVVFLVYRKDATDGASWSRVGVTKTGADSFTDKTVKPGKSYFFTVKAYYKAEDGTKYLSKSSGDYSIKTVPAKPVFKLISNCGAGVVMQWEERSDATGFTIYRSPTAAKGSWTKIATVRSNKAGQFIDTKVNIGETYYYLFKAYKTINGTNYVSDISKIHKKVISDVAVPENLNAQPTSEGILFSYDKVPGTSGYAVYRRDAGQNNWKRIATQKSVNKLEWLDKTAEAGKTYYYTVKSYKTVNGNTSYSPGAQSVPATATTGMSSINVSVSEIRFSELLEKQTIRIYVDGAPKYDTLKFSIDDELVATGTWGKWDGNTIDLTITRIGPGETTLRIYYDSLPDADVLLNIYADKLDLDDDYLEAKDLISEAYDIFSEALSLLSQSQDDSLTDAQKAELIREAVDKASEVTVILEEAKVLAEKYASINDADAKLIDGLLRISKFIQDFVNADSLESPLIQTAISYLERILESAGLV
ncbi:MAG: fibronectin type III domain-containing protein [Ruminococcaceae bacterium]|nr:fibronectin type III domain-containing protein [Oscillospiraceae bacterium]